VVGALGCDHSRQGMVLKPEAQDAGHVTFFDTHVSLTPTGIVSTSAELSTALVAEPALHDTMLQLVLAADIGVAGTHNITIHRHQATLEFWLMRFTKLNATFSQVKVLAGTHTVSYERPCNRVRYLRSLVSVTEETCVRADVWDTRCVAVVLSITTATRSSARAIPVKTPD